MGTGIMRKFKLQSDERPIEPSQAQIERHKNVERFYHDYELLTKRSKKPIYRDRKLYLLMVLIGIILFLLFLED
jgi:hypothetical protein